jgi:pimeloyl-ACP methyl ester carboxylesterase
MVRYVREPLLSGPEYRRRLGLIASFDARPWLHEIKSPSLVILGRRDPVVPARATHELGRLLPNATIRELGCGHLTYLAMSTALRSYFQEWSEQLDQRPQVPS